MIHGCDSLSKLDIESIVVDTGYLSSKSTLIDVFSDALVDIEIGLFVEGNLVAVKDV